RQLAEKLDTFLVTSAVDDQWREIKRQVSTRLALLADDMCKPLAALDGPIAVAHHMDDAIHAVLTHPSSDARVARISNAMLQNDAQMPPVPPARTLRDHRQRVVAARAGMIAADERLKRGEYVLAEAVARSWIDRLYIIRERMLALPTKTAPLIAV